MLPICKTGAVQSILRIALLHLAPIPGDLSGNRLMLENAISKAAANNAHLIITPELCTTGYDFSKTMGTDWIQPQPDKWMNRFSKKVARLGVTVFLSLPERDAQTGRMYNSVFIIGPHGRLIGKHRKIQTIKGGTESWSAPGEKTDVFPVPLLGNVGILICADAYPSWIAKRLKKKGADILISVASWGRGLYGPSGEWERCSKDTGLTMIVCNRTGMDQTLDFQDAESAVIVNGKRVHTMVSKSPAIFIIEVNPVTQLPLSKSPLKIFL